MSDESEAKKTLREKMADLTFKQKIEYLWEYEKWKLIIPLIVIVVIFSLAKTIMESMVDYDLYICMINSSEKGDSNLDFVDDFIRNSDLNEADTKIRIESGITHPWNEKDEGTNDLFVTGVERYRGSLMTNKVDITFAGSYWTVNMFAESDTYCDLSQLLSESLYNELSGRLYYAKDSSGNEIPVGLMLYDIDSICKYFREPPILVVSKSSENKEMTIKFIEWLFK